MMAGHFADLESDKNRIGTCCGHRIEEIILEVMQSFEGKLYL